MKLFFYTPVMAALASAVVAGCAQAPLSEPNTAALPGQEMVRSAGQWQAIAADAARSTLKMLDEAGVASNARVSLVRPDKPTEFESVFHELLITELVRTGRRVTQDNTVALKLSYKAQLIRNSAVAGAGGDVSRHGARGTALSELVLTTSAGTPDQILARKTDLYYVESADAPLFKLAPLHNSMKVVNQ